MDPKIDIEAQAATNVSMASSIILRARVDPRRKAAAERILQRYGITLPQFINMSLAQVELRKGLPFRMSAEGGVPTKAETVAFWSEIYNDDYTR